MAETKNKSIYLLLAKIQQDLKAPKGQYNSFAKFSYRSCEDILEAVKPLLGNLALTISDEVVAVGERYYVKATAKLRNGKEAIVSTACAREALEKKGMDVAQITGAASSYARKYALNGLFAIDDTKDADSGKTAKEAKPAATKASPRITQAQKKKIFAMGKKQGKDSEEMKEACKRAAGGVESFNDISKVQASKIIEHMITKVEEPADPPTKEEQLGEDEGDLVGEVPTTKGTPIKRSEDIDPGEIPF